MRKKILINISVLPVILGLMFIFAHTASADTTTATQQSSSYIGGVATDAIATVLSYVANLALHIMSLWLALTGALLNVSIAMTMHIKDFVDSTQGVYLVWQTIRDVSGLFMIFMLLYASFKIILGFDSVGGVGTLIKNIVIVGILINFSFFITSMLIDASNIVSLALYNGIVGETTTTQTTSTNCPATKNGQQTGSLNTCTIVSEMYTGNQSGISAIFLNFLSPQLIYNGYNSSLSSSGATDSTNSTSADGSAGPSLFKIIVQGIVGCIIMFTSGLSFLLAALAFMVRLIILIFLLAFSPIWFASWVIPGLDDKAKEFTNQLKAQLIFMPVYLLLLYAALKFLSMSTVFTNPSGNVFSGSTSDLSSLIPVNYIVLAINDFFIIFMLNIPLVVAFSMGGVATKLINSDKFNASAIWKKAGGAVGSGTRTVGSWAGTRTVGSWASSADKAFGNTRIGNSLLMRDFRSATVGALAKSKMGGSRSYDDLSKERKDIAKKNNTIDRQNDFKKALADIKAGRPPVIGKSVKDSLSAMSASERLALGKNTLADPEVLKHLKGADFEAIKKSDDIPEEDKNAIAAKRKEIFEKAIQTGDLGTVASMSKAYDGKDLLGIDNSLLSNTNILQHLNQGQLKAISDNSNNATLKFDIATAVLNSSRLGVRIPTVGYITKNRVEWGV